MKHTQTKYKERPRCRKIILKLIKGYNLKEIAEGHSKTKHIFFSFGLKRQAQKMLQEKSEGTKK